MALQLYFQRESKYWSASSQWLALSSPENGLNNLGYLMTTFETLVWDTVAYWPVEPPNGSASYTRNNGPEGLLVLGPFNGLIPEYGEVQIPDNRFFYEDAPEMPVRVIDTPFLLRGMATALKERVQPHHAGAKPFVFWVRYDGTPNRPGVLNIRRHQW